MNKSQAFFLILFCFSSLAKNNFEVGSGSKYQMKVAGGAVGAQVSIYITENKFGTLGVEYYTTTLNSLMPVKMWQQFVLGMEPGSPMFIKEGYVKTPELSAPEKLTSAYLNVNEGGVRVDDFLFSKPEELEKFKKGQEMVEVPAGKVSALHYQKKRGNQIIDFWISDQAKPISLIKLVSKGKKPSHNYVLELLELLKGVKPEIDKKKAVPLSKKGKSFLPKPL